MRAVLALAVGTALVLGTGEAAAERMTFPSSSPKDAHQLLHHEGPPATIYGELTFPAAMQAPVPAMVIEHGAGGFAQGREKDWAAAFNADGVAALIVDGFGARGIRSTDRDESLLSPWTDTADVLSGLAALAADPRIDPKRIGVIGFSRGGKVVLETMLDSIRAAVLGNDTKFALHVALYPSCSPRYVGKRVTGAPLAMFLGEKDDYTPIAPCLDHAKWFESMGAPVSTTVYPGAYHKFDAIQAFRWLPDVETNRACATEINVDTGERRRTDTGETVTDIKAFNQYQKDCVNFGAHVGGDAEARDKVFPAVRALVKRTFDLP